MSKHYMLYREDLINLLLNHKTYISQKAREAIAQGRDITQIPLSETKYWTERFFDEQVEKGSIKVEHILDQVDEIVKHTHGKTAREIAQQIKESN